MSTKIENISTIFEGKMSIIIEKMSTIIENMSATFEGKMSTIIDKCPLLLKKNVYCNRKHIYYF